MNLVEEGAGMGVSGMYSEAGWGPLRRRLQATPLPTLYSLKVNVSVLWALVCVRALDCVLLVSLCI